MAKPRSPLHPEVRQSVEARQLVERASEDGGPLTAALDAATIPLPKLGRPWRVR